MGGELTLLMGPSGSGKTTLLSILGCMLTPNKGTLSVCGDSAEKASPEQLAEIRRAHIGFIFQSYHLFPTLTAAENIQLALDIRGQNSSQAIKKSHKLLEKVGLSRKGASFPREMSGGEQQRVAIARAIVANPSVILADEPTAALDTDNGRAIMNILSELAKDQNSAVLAVSHDSRVIPFADKIIYIEDGILKNEDPAARTQRARQRKN
jgi:putative ABC transport system ATP-binding protein